MKHLSAGKPASKSIRKQLEKRIDEALDTLQQTRLGDSDIHEARKALKKARASLRLIRPCLKDSQYRLENNSLRDAAKPLSALRDAKVLGDTLEELVKRYGAPMRAFKLESLKKILKENRAQQRRDILHGRSDALAHSRRLLRESRHRVRHIDVEYDGWPCLGTGLQRVYEQGRRGLQQARDKPEPKTFHEWRKQVKYLRYSLELLCPLWPQMIEAVAGQAHELSNYLGDDHDLTVLTATSSANRDSLLDANLEGLTALIAKCQGELREKALSLGMRLYEEKPKVFVRRFAHYWSTWVHEQPT